MIRAKALAKMIEAIMRVSIATFHQTATGTCFVEEEYPSIEAE
jgi:hypothetical protein